MEHLNGLKGSVAETLEKQIKGGNGLKEIWDDSQIKESYKCSGLLKIVTESNESTIEDDFTMIKLMFSIIESIIESDSELDQRNIKGKQEEELEQSIELLKADVTKQVDETLEKLQKENEKLVTENESKTKQIERLQQVTRSIIDEYKLKIRKSKSDLNTITDDQKQVKLPELKSHLTKLQDTIQDIKDLEGKLPWTTKILPGSSSSNTIYKIEYVLGGGEPPIVIEEFSYPTQKSVRSRNAAVAKRLILLLLAQKPVEDDEVDKAQGAVYEAEEKLKEANSDGQTLENTALKEAEKKLKEAKDKAKENEKSLKNKLYKNVRPNLAEAVKQIAFLGKTGVRVYKTSKASSNGRKKRAFARAADCYGAIPVVFRTILANLDAGFAFNKDKEREAI